MGARYYDSTIGRFISADPLGGASEVPSATNLYAYANNNPVGMTDLGGLAAAGEGNPSVACVVPTVTMNKNDIEQGQDFTHHAKALVQLPGGGVTQLMVTWKGWRSRLSALVGPSAVVFVSYSIKVEIPSGDNTQWGSHLLNWATGSVRTSKGLEQGHSVVISDEYKVRADGKSSVTFNTTRTLFGPRYRVVGYAYLDKPWPGGAVTVGIGFIDNETYLVSYNKYKGILSNSGVTDSTLTNSRDTIWLP